MNDFDKIVFCSKVLVLCIGLLTVYSVILFMPKSTWVYSDEVEVLSDE